MIDGKRVVVFVPYGRERTVSILVKYLERDHSRGIIDEAWLCLNTDPSGQEDDLRYAHRLAAEHDWIKTVDRPEDCPRRHPKQLNTGYFYRLMIDPGTVYVRCDDDIIYVHEDAISNLVSARLRMHGSVLGAFPVMVNNAVVSWHLQQRRLIPGPSDGWESVALPYCMDAVGWASGPFAERLHRLLLEKIETGKVEDLYIYEGTIPLAPRQQFSVSFFAVDGRDYCELDPPGVLDFHEEEHWLTVHRPEKVGKSNVIIGDSVVSHYTFSPQQPHINATDILDRYRALAEKL